MGVFVPDHAQRVLPSILARTEADARRALALDLSRLCHAHGPQRVGLTIGCDEKTIRNARDEGATLKLHNAFNLLCVDLSALDTLAAEWGVQILPLNSGGSRDATVKVARIVPHLVEAERNDGAFNIGDLIKMEADLRASHRATGALLAQIDRHRGVGRAA